jgi:hypothetical protein
MKPYVLGLEEGQAIWMFDALDTIKADAERMGGGLALWSSSTSRAPRSRCTSTTAGTRAQRSRWRVRLHDRGRDGGGVVRIVAVCAARDSARVAVQFTQGAAPQCDCAWRLRGLLPPGGRERAGTNAVAGPQRAGCRSPVEHGGPVRHQDRGATTRGGVIPERGRATRALWWRSLTPRARSHGGVRRRYRCWAETSHTSPRRRRERAACGSARRPARPFSFHARGSCFAGRRVGARSSA